MANGHGGYRQPTNPSPVSGPGALSQRTDGPLHGPVPGGNVGAGQQPVGPDPSMLTPLDAPTEYPDMPLTSGMSGGPGAGPSLPVKPPMNQEDADRLRSYLPPLIFQASMPNASASLKQYVRQLRAELG